jgi:hypothetical protein
VAQLGGASAAFGPPRSSLPLFWQGALIACVKASDFPWYAWLASGIGLGIVGAIAFGRGDQGSGASGDALVLAGLVLLTLGACLIVVGVIRMVKWALRD